MTARQPPKVNNTWERPLFVDFGDALNVLRAPLDLSSAMNSDTGRLIVSSQFLMLPILLLVLGLVVILVYGFVYVFQFLCCCECRQKVIPTTQVEVIKNAIHNYQSCCTATFYTLCFYMMLAMQLVAYRRFDLLDGVADSLSFGDFLVSQTKALSTSAATLSSAVGLMVADVKENPSSCVAKNLSSIVTSLASEASGFSSTIKPMTDLTTQLKSNMGLAFGDRISVEVAVWAIYAVPMLAGMLLAYNHWHRNTLGVKVFLTAGTLVYLCTLVASFLFMSTTMILANFCMNPLSSLVSLAPPTLQPTATYYASCFGANPTLNHTAFATAHLNSLDRAYNTSCSWQTTVPNFTAHKKTSRDALEAAQSTLSCKAVRAQIVFFTQTSVCVSFYNFAYSVWIAMHACSIFMFTLFIIGATAYRFESEEQIDWVVEHTYDPSKTQTWETFKRSSGIGSPGKRGGSSRVSDWSSDTESDYGGESKNHKAHHGHGHGHKHDEHRMATITEGF